ncbi:SDR family NAD(P)-dependent oxidoreductase [Paraburkholderia sp. CNPSo 3272]|uniref:SDR family NAD(P)-dependent oxidoreductase n=1 Tax=Paraburkholderia sp. CNPSo 3272 TaxID=2940931 RepID=UPI0020B7AB6C|nr:SDR family NAD(P)-dependent oxidoreductase [Paraburkholderia sp. CNPSo 3272]MCP3726127.1 SDR family NAD(P)-dependent oxidoreductase [Paraburkholderia sp. CNPSo 3272]
MLSEAFTHARTRRPVLQFPRQRHAATAASANSSCASSASKAAIQGLADSLAQEIAAPGIKVTIVEPGPLNTDFAGSSVHSTPIECARRSTPALLPCRVADPATVGREMLNVVDSERAPMRVLFGPLAAQVVPHVFAKRLKTWDEWSSADVHASIRR